jgi:hypothetical protein
MPNENNPCIGYTITEQLGLQIWFDDDRQEFYTHAREVARSFDKILLNLPHAHGDRYRSVYQVLAAKKCCCIIQFDPLLDANAPLVIEFRLMVMDVYSKIHITQILREMLGLRYEHCMRNGVLSHYKFGVDIDNATLETLHFYDDLKRTTTLTFNGHGILCALELGSPTSDQYLRLSLENHKDALRHDPDEYFDQKSRIQVMAIVKNQQLPMREIGLNANPFAGLSVIKLPEDSEVKKNTRWRGFLDSCRYRGVYAALARISDKDLRTKYRERLCQEMIVNWWDPAAVWSRLTDEIRSNTLFALSNVTEATTKDS